MKIVLVSPLPLPAGGIATWTKGYLASKQVESNNIDIVNTAVKGSRVNNFTKKNLVDEISRFFLILKEMRKKLRLNNPDIVHLNTSCSKFGMIRDILCLSLVKRSKTKIVLHCHCDTNYMVKDKLSKFIFRKMCIKSDKILVLNLSSYKHVKTLTGKKSIIIPNFIKEDIIDNKYIKKVSNEIKNILFVGHIVKAKGCDDIISIAKKMPKKKFTMIGYLSDEINDIYKPENVEYIGEVNHDEVIKYMKSYDLFLFPTYTEGFPNVVLEAMACGMPIISTNVGAIPDMLETNGGIIVEPRDIKSIKSAINELEDKELRLNMSNWNRKKVEEKYTLHKVINEIFLEYENILSEDEYENIIKDNI
ncbi:glycosyltransferase family 1 protein [Paraclostridium sordellii 8483]|uniref:glycosyltransferase family 4 protein n=1 Tax=Paraclostridium sordellii TaxID=1505 RepID=UPI0002F66EDC|nr:glycosyltransferase family 4 protein [Paeniclostridium sordellii]TAN67480.1 glycosyltransferase family 1 protein [Paeniclostridium sordellii 8483]